MITLDPQEQVLFIVRRHWFAFVVGVLPLLFAALAPLLFFLPSDFRAAFSFNKNLAFYAYTLWLLFLWALFFVRLTDYYLDVWIVTEKRIIDIEQFGLFRRKTSTADLSRIQDTTIEVSGIIATFLGFGNVRIQTAGEFEEIVIRSASNPQKVKERILAAADEAKARYGSTPL